MSRLTKGDEETTARALSVLMEYYVVLMKVYKAYVCSEHYFTMTLTAFTEFCMVS